MIGAAIGPAFSAIVSNGPIESPASALGAEKTRIVLDQPSERSLAIFQDLGLTYTPEHAAALQEILNLPNADSQFSDIDPTIASADPREQASLILRNLRPRAEELIAQGLGLQQERHAATRDSAQLTRLLARLSSLSSLFPDLRGKIEQATRIAGGMSIRDELAISGHRALERIGEARAWDGPAPSQAGLVPAGLPQIRSFRDIRLLDSEWGVNNRVPYIISNEAGIDELMERLEVDGPSGRRRLHFGFSGWPNLDIMAARRSTLGILADISDREMEMWALVEHAIQADTPGQFVETITSYLGAREARSPGYFFKPRSDINEGPLAVNYLTESALLSRELTRAGSWLLASRPEKYGHIREMFLSGRIAPLRLNVLDSARFQSLGSWIKMNVGRADTVYLSNIREWITGKRRIKESPPVADPAANNASMDQSIASIAGDGTYIIESERSPSSPMKAVVHAEALRLGLPSSHDPLKMRRQVLAILAAGAEDAAARISGSFRASFDGARISGNYYLRASPDNPNEYLVFEQSGMRRALIGSTSLVFEYSPTSGLAAKIGANLQPDYQKKGLALQLVQMVEECLPEGTELYERILNIPMLISFAKNLSISRPDLLERILSASEAREFKEILDYWDAGKNGFVDEEIYRKIHLVDVMGRDLLNDAQLGYLDETSGSPGESRADARRRIQANWQLRQKRLLRYLAKILGQNEASAWMLRGNKFFSDRIPIIRVVSNSYGEKRIEIRWRVRRRAD